MCLDEENHLNSGSEEFKYQTTLYMELIGLKFIAWVVILYEGALGAVIPYMFRSHKAVLDIGKAFGGGVFASCAFLHLLPEVAGKLPEILGIGEIPVDFLIMLLVFLLLLIIE